MEEPMSEQSEILRPWMFRALEDQRQIEARQKRERRKRLVFSALFLLGGVLVGMLV